MKAIGLLSLLVLISGALSCEKKTYNESSFACICTTDSCALPGKYEIPQNEVLTYSNSRDELRAEYGSIAFSDEDIGGDDALVVRLNASKTYQSIIGFGGAFTDAAGLNIKTLSKELQETLMTAYFTEDGADYNLARVPIAGSDFSTRPYSYVDKEGDTKLESFEMAEEDHMYKFPYIKHAMKLSKQDLFLFGSPWSPPSWMKTNKKFNESGTLMPEMWGPWSRYFVKFIEAYEKELGIEMWGVTTQNEPLSGFTPWKWNTLGWRARDQRDWIATSLGPTLQEAGYRRVKLMIHDFNRDSLPSYPTPMITAKNSSKFIDGIAVHWYEDKNVSPEVLDETYQLDPSKFMLYTEGCSGWNYIEGDYGVKLGSWARGEDYITDIIENLNHWQGGWVDWNLVLDTDGGPNWAGNLVDAPILTNAEKDEFYLQPSYFAMTHFSKFIARDAKRIHFMTSKQVENFHFTALQNPDKSIVMVVANEGDEEIMVNVKDDNDKSFGVTVAPRSWHTLVYAQ